MNKKILATILVALCGNAIAASPQLRIRIPTAGISAPAQNPVTPPGTGTPEVPVTPSVPPNTPILTVSQTVMDFGAVKIGTSSTLEATARNTGSAALTIDYVSRPYSPFAARTAGQKPCSTGMVLPVGDTCSIRINFSPYAEDDVEDEYSLDSSGGYLVIAVKGHGAPLPAPLTVSQAPSGSLGIYAVGTTSGMGSYEYRFKNNTTLALTPTGTTTRNVSTGEPGGTISANTCVGSVQPGATCGLTFTPTYAAPGVITLTFAETSKQTSVEYSITAEEPLVNWESSSVSGLTKRIVLTNPNKLIPVSILATSVLSSDAGFSDVASHFDISGCEGTTLAAGQSCTMTVTYLPAKGALNAVTVMPAYLTGRGTTSRIAGSTEKWW